ncbi:unnamed protein product [Orchesella dallaii]|uniref:Uncharacterized protein n=1 Tax=Orchesella dallaii TaxID=48710 RepID=A0ABP1SAH1_9HEXA
MGRERKSRHRSPSNRSDLETKVESLSKAVEKLTKLHSSKSRKHRRRSSSSDSCDSRRSTHYSRKYKRRSRSRSSVRFRSRSHTREQRLARSVSPKSDRSRSQSIFSSTDGFQAPFNRANASPKTIQTNGDDDDVLEISVLDEDTKKLLGDDPNKPAHGPKLHDEVASRWSAIVKSGLHKDEREKIKIAYLPPPNCSYGGPKLNPELRQAIPTVCRDTDDDLRRIQDHLEICANVLGQLTN